jgi:4-aminobutyrate aminotransferase-like enzyme
MGERRMATRKLIADKLKKDRRVLEAKRLLKAALRDHQKELTDLKAGDVRLRRDYEKRINSIGRYRGRDLVYPYLASGIGKGALVELADGSVKYDFITGIGVHFLGHSHEKMLASGVDAALDDTVMQGHLQQGVVTLDLLRKLVRAASKRGAPLKHCFLTSSGAMANENALKIIFQNKFPASRILAFEKCFAGRTLAMAQVTDKAAGRVGLPQTMDVDYIPFYDPDHPRESTDRAVSMLKRHLARYPGQYAAMCFELIQGEGGYYSGSKSFFVALMKILKENKVAVLVDEIQTFGRTTELFAFQYYGLNSYVDAVTVGKMLQICATFFTEAFNPKPGLLSQTFTSSTSAIYAACTILDELSRGGYLGKNGKISKLSKHIMKRLGLLSKRHPGWIHGPFGLGAMIAFSVFDGSPKTTWEFLKALYEAGVIAFPAGDKPTRVRMLMPVGAVTISDINRVTDIIEKTLTTVSKNTRG